MADTASRWLMQRLQSGKPARLVVLAGSGHCHRSAIPRRIQRRTGLEVLSVRPLSPGDLGRSEAPRDDEFDLLLIAEQT